MNPAMQKLTGDLRSAWMAAQEGGHNPEKLRDMMQVAKQYTPKEIQAQEGRQL